MERSSNMHKSPETVWPPTPQSILQRPLVSEDLASFSLLPPPLLPQPVIYGVPYPMPVPAVKQKDPVHSPKETKSLQPPSPLSLSDAEMEDADATEEDADAYQPDTRPIKGVAGASGPSRPSAARKASHSVIERRRRERINETLTRLVELVPGCRSALQAKDAKAARSRRRSKKASGDGPATLNVGGLHKLDVLLATVEHIEDLHRRLGISDSESRLSLTNDSSLVASPDALQPMSAPSTSGPATEDVKSAAASLLALASPVVQPVRD